MKQFEQLTDEQKKAAVDKCATRLLEAILDGAIRFNDRLNHDNLQRRIDAACKKADKMRTPWFAHEYIMDTCRDEIMGMAQCDAEDVLYSESMIALLENPNAVILMDTENKIVATASNISEDFTVKIVTERSAFVAEAANKPFNSTRLPQPE